MTKTVILCALALLATGFLLPVGATASWFADSSSPRFASIADGVVIFKGLLALHGLLLVLAARFRPRGATFEPLVTRGFRASTRGNASTIWGLGGLMVLALALRLTRLEVGISYDEIDTLVHYARKPLSEVVSTFDSQNQHLAFSVLARLSVAAFGESTWAVRLPAALLGVISIWAMYRFAALVTDRREALFAAALLTVSYHHVWFSQNARGYTGLLLFTLLGTTSFVKMLTERSPNGFARPFSYGAWMALATLTHATAVLIIAAHGVVWLWCLWSSRRRNVGANRWQPGMGFVFAASLACLGYALVLPQFFHTLLAPTMPGSKTEWKEPSWLLLETLRGLSRGVPGGMFTLAGALVVAALGVRSYFKQGLELFALFVLPTLVTAAALVATKHNLWPRMFFSSAGFFVLIALRGVTEWARIFSFGQLQGLIGKMTTAALTLLCLMSATTVVLGGAWAPKQDFEGALEYVQKERRPDDAVVTVDMTTMPYAELFTAPWTPVDNVDALRAIESAHPRTWLVYCTPTRMTAAQPEIWERVQALYSMQRTFWGTLGGSEVVVTRFPAEEPSK